MENRVFVVTGVTSGVGKALAFDLAKTGGTVVMVARDADRGQAVLEETKLQAQTPNVDLQLCDLLFSHLDEGSFRAFASLHLAGIQPTPKGQ